MEMDLDQIQVSRKIQPDYAFRAVLFLLVLIGIVMVYSSSYIYSKEVMGSSLHFFSRQLVYVILGTSFAWVVSKTKFKFWLDNAFLINFALTMLVLLTFLPGMGGSVNGAHRWLRFGFFSLQPGEFLKYGIVLSSLSYFENFFNYTKEQKLQRAGMLLFPLALLLAQPDFGTFTICLFVITYVCFMSKFPRKWFMALLAMGAMGAVSLLFLAPYRVQRILTYLDPWKDPKNTGFQIIQSYLAFANGSVFGQGIGNSNEKLFYLPEAYNDFIFSVIGEELGFVGVLFIVFLFLNLVYWGLKIAVSSPSRVITIFISSITVLIGFQAFLNMGVVLGLLPTKGLNLPFISYGGSSLLANFFAIGLLFSAKRQSDKLYCQIHGMNYERRMEYEREYEEEEQERPNPQQSFWS